MITRLSHTTVFVLDHDVAHNFYVEKLGFTVGTDVTMEDGFRFFAVSPPKQPDLNILLMKVKPPDPAPSTRSPRPCWSGFSKEAGLAWGYSNATTAVRPTRNCRPRASSFVASLRSSSTESRQYSRTPLGIV